MVWLPVIFNRLKQTSRVCFAYLITRTSSWKAWSTFILIFADASMYITFSCRANCCPSSCVTWNSKNCVWDTVLTIRSVPTNPWPQITLLIKPEAKLICHRWTERLNSSTHTEAHSAEQVRRTYLWQKQDFNQVITQKLLNATVINSGKEKYRCNENL